MVASSTSDDDVRTDEDTLALPLDAEDVYSRKDYYRRCGFFIERSFGPRLDDSIEKLSKSFGKSNPSKEEQIRTQSSINVAQVAQSSSTSSLPSSSTHAPQVPQGSTSLLEASLPASTTGSLGISTLDVEGDNNFLLPGEVRDQLNITDVPDGYREMILPELQALATNIMNEHNGNRVTMALQVVCGLRLLTVLNWQQTLSGCLLKFIPRVDPLSPSHQHSVPKLLTNHTATIPRSLLFGQVITSPFCQNNNIVDQARKYEDK
ncbi:hypothetical protein BC941DRAFT_476291 [Chlamydoabsidia padenii]|nr:hypothetical protein BC941DRAFT_476291 [Chlamydoabsidia padenii]